MKVLTVSKLIFVCMFVLSYNMHCQSEISGKVTDANGLPVPYATVFLQNTQLSVLTSEDGAFKFTDLPNGLYVLQTKCFGFLEKTDTLILQEKLIFNPILKISSNQLDEVVVDATRVDKNSGMAYNTIDKETIKKQNLGQDAPYMLNALPNVVVNSDAGNGVGYTSLRIRGSDATRINVTINGVPVNDAESQNTFWVNMPDLLSSVNNIQVQRGVGASSNGSGAFGASINFQTNSIQDKPYANVISTAGSYNTFRNTLAAGTGLLNNKFTLDARASKISSNGYIDRASSDLYSYYVAAGYYGKKSVLKFINFSGSERTYQSWNYVSEDSIKKGNRTYNSCGEYFDADGKTQYYKGETDNYKQNNSQLHFIRQINSRIHFNLTAHYTKGKGYYEQYKQGQAFTDYRLQPVITAKGDTLQTTDMVRRLWLDNDFAGGIFNFNYTASSRLAFTLGGGYNTYFGKHFGRVVWSQYASDGGPDHNYYMNTSNKNDQNIYLKTNYHIASQVNLFVDLQSRSVTYRFLGYNDSLLPQMQNADYTFFNPKIGLSADISSRLNVYASLSVGNKEPNRDDFVQSTPGNRPKAERLTDLEAGFKYVRNKLLIAANIYDMEYTNQLVLNGKINNVGAYNRVNVARSYRRGVEIEAGVKLSKYVSLSGNLALSRNKIADYVEFIDSSDVNFSFSSQHENKYKSTDISFSPNVVTSAILAFKPLQDLEISFIHKYVGRQYLDNTTNINRSLNPYSVLDVRLNYTIRTKAIPEINFMFAVYNALNEKYETNGYTFSYYTDQTLNTFNYLAPAAPLNFLGGISLKF